MEMSQALTVKQVASLLNVNARTVYRMATNGKLPGFKVADNWRFLPSDIYKWIEAQKYLSSNLK
ncbi:helix-turn-helix domain-containing protein [Bilophila wadsworthia]|jgi:excisionase family DNA binding protein